MNSNPELLVPSRLGSLRCTARRAGATMRIVCLPWSGAGASVFRGFAAAMPDHVELWSMQRPGREERIKEPCFSHMEQVVSSLLPDLAMLADLPLVLFGHSFGALSAYETALAMPSRLGCAPKAVIVSGHVAPSFIDMRRRKWRHTTDEEFISHIEALGGTPKSIMDNETLFRMLLPCIRGDFNVLENYVVHEADPLGCPLLACGGREDPMVSRESLLAWNAKTASSFGFREFDGDHFYLTSRFDALAREVLTWLEDPAARPFVENEPGTVRLPLSGLQRAYVRASGAQLPCVPPHAYRCLMWPELDLDRLSRVLARLVRRHPMLRTSLPDGVAQQIMPPPASIALAFADLRSLDEDARALVMAQRRQPVALVDLAAALKIACRVDRTGDGFQLHVHLSLLTLDTRSIDLFFEELLALYADASVDREDDDAATGEDDAFERFMRQQSSPGLSPDFARANAYWRGRASALARPLHLGRDATVRAVGPVRSEQRLSLPQTRALAALAHRSDVSLTVLALSIYLECLRTESLAQHFSIGLMVSRRPSLALRDMRTLGNYSQLICVEAPAPGCELVEGAQALQDQLRRDLEHVGITSLQDEPAAAAGPTSANVPVTFASMLGHACPTGDAPYPRIEAQACVVPGMAITQCVSMQHDQLVFGWDCDEAAVAPGSFARLTAAHRRFIENLCECAPAD